MWTNFLYIVARVIEPDGTLGGIAVLSELNHHKLAPVVAWDGERFLVVWHNSRRVDFDYGDVRGQFIDIVTEAPVLSGANIYVSTKDGDQLAPAIAYGIGSYLVTWVQETVVDSGADNGGRRIDCCSSGDHRYA